MKILANVFKETPYTDYEDYERYKIALPHLHMEDIEQIKGRGGVDCYYFSNMPAKSLFKLIEKGYVREYRENGYDDNVCSLAEVVEILQKCPKLKVAGYIINNIRDDRRISIEAISLDAKDTEGFKAVSSLGLLPDVQTTEELDTLENSNKLNTVKFWHIVIP